MNRIFKLLTSVSLMIVLLISLLINSLALSSTVKKNAIAPKPDANYIILDGKPMIFLRKVCDKIGCGIVWDKEKGQIICNKGTVEIKLYPDEKNVEIDGSTKALGDMVRIVGGKTVVPLSFPWSALNAKVIWDSKKKTVSVTRGPGVFFGDSITLGFNLKKYFPKANLINKGVSGNTTADALKRVDEVINRKPDIVFIMLGTNDIWTNENLETTMSNYNSIITKIRLACPYTDVVIQSTMPFGKAAMKRNSKVSNIKVQSLNLRLQEMVKECGLKYVDIGSSFKDSNGLLDSRYTSDGVHIFLSSYKKWADIIRNMLLKI